MNAQDILIKKPKYKQNYRAGYVGFTFNNKSFVSNGIIFFTKKPSYWLKVSHCFLVEDEDNGLEATLNKEVNGVRRFKLEEYFHNPNIHVIFCKPKNLYHVYVQLMLKEGRKHLGQKYDLPLFAGFILRWILRPLENIPWLRSKASIFNSKASWICSEYVSTCLKKTFLYGQIDPLKTYHSSKITPQMLFHSHLWQEWNYWKGGENQ